MPSRVHSRFAFAIISVLLLDCSTSRSQAKEITAYGEALRSGSEIELIKDFNSAFKLNRNWITEYGGVHPMFNAVALVYGRYIVTLQIPLKLNANQTAVVETGDAKFYVTEVEAVSLNELSISYTPHQMQFDSDSWGKIRRNQNDFSAIGYSMITDKPVAKLDRVWWQG